jgi:hypothetical protein
MVKTGGGDATPLNSSVRLLNERFPHVRDRATCLFEQDETFRELCDDYAACVGTVARLEACGHTSESMRNEYAALQLRLERELLRYLEERPESEIS